MLKTKKPRRGDIIYTFVNEILRNMKTWQTSNGYIIVRVLFGRTNIFMISNGSSNLLVDTGIKGDGKRLLKRIDLTGKPDAVILTHTHFDHTGNASLLKERFSPLFIVQEKEKEFLESGDSPIPKGTMRITKLIYNLGAERKLHMFHVPGVKGDIVFGERYDLKDFGFNGYVMHTPGHSAGSCSVIVENEIAITGDTLGGFIPGSLLPPWGDDVPGMIRSWRKLLDTGCHTFLPAHGLPVSRRRLERDYHKRSKRS